VSECGDGMSAQQRMEAEEREQQTFPLASADMRLPAHRAALWERMLDNIRQRLGMSRYSIWFKQTELMHIDESRVVIGVPNVIIQQYLQQQYAEPVCEAAQELLGHPCSVRFEIAPKLLQRMRARQQKEVAALQREEPALDFGAEQPSDSSRQEGRRFEDLIVTESNRLPFVAAKEIALQAEPRFNFLIVWGSLGSGKSALLEALRYCAATSGHCPRIEHATAESWCNEYYYALQEKRTKAFRERYRRCNLLVIDDVHFVEGKPAAQDELMHTVKSLLSSGARVVLSSVRHPDELKDIKPELKTVLREAFLAKLVFPSSRERQAVIRGLAERCGLNATAAVYRFLAESDYRNLRELRCAVSSLAAFAALEGKPTVDMAVAMRGLAAMSRSRQVPVVQLDDIARVVCEVMGVRQDQLTGSSRARRTCQARQSAMYLARQLTDASLSEIGRFFGGKTHSTVKYAVQKVAERIKTDQTAARLIEAIQTRLRQG